MILRPVNFRTARLHARDWHTAPLPSGQTLSEIVSPMLTPATTRSLPSAWHGHYEPERTRAWIDERDHESTTLLVTTSESGDPIGLLILSEADTDDESEVRFGYLLAETAWGHGYATELVAGLVNWCRTQTPVWSLVGGVENDNPASARVLTKNGFRQSGPPQDGERTYKLTLHR